MNSSLTLSHVFLPLWDKTSHPRHIPPPHVHVWVTMATARSIVMAEVWYPSTDFQEAEDVDRLCPSVLERRFSHLHQYCARMYSVVQGNTFVSAMSEPSVLNCCQKWNE